MIGTSTGAETGAETEAYTGATPSIAEAVAVFTTTSLAGSRATAKTGAFAGSVHVSPAMAGTSDLSNRLYMIDKFIYRHTQWPPEQDPVP